MWGTPHLIDSGKLRHRFIPTHVGNSRDTRAGKSTETGSSPRMWGTLHRIFSDPETPVHPPRMWGTSVLQIRTHRVDGSSPRMWGTLVLRTPGLPNISVHPHACGELYLLRLSSMRRTVHPHACGELGCWRAAGRYFAGSSPRMWGTPYLYASKPPGGGSSPRMWGTPWSVWTSQHVPVHPHACGELPPNQFLLITWTVHPHACGELGSGTAIERKTDVGSSPRMWGTLQSTSFTGTRIGSSPRMWGTLHLRCINAVYFVGSSPRMWGTLFHVTHRFAPRRFIPTHVGNS